MTYSLQFTERMTGAFSFGEADYQAGYAAGRRAGNRLLFRLTIAADDVDSYGPTFAGKVEALDSFGQLFLSELWRVFGPVRRLARKAVGNGAPA